MYDVLRVSKRAFTIAVAAATILWSVGVSAFIAPLAAQAAVMPLSSVPAGSLIKGATHSAVYYYDGTKRYVFPNLKTYQTWYGNDFSSVLSISMADLGTIMLGGNVAYRPGTRLVKVDTVPNVYAVGPNGRLFWVKDEAAASSLFGANWASRIDDVPDAFFTNYSSDLEDDLMAGGKHPDGSLLSSGGKTYYVEGGAVREVSASAFEGNGFMDANVIAVSSVSSYTAGSALGTNEVASPAQSASSVAPAPVPGVAGSVSVSLAGNTPAGRTILADSTSGNGAEAVIDLMHVNFTAGSAPVTVTSLKFKRTGVAADADVQNAYLYDGSSRLAEKVSFSDKVLTFSNSSGLFIVPANTTRTISLKMDLTNGTSASKTIGFEIPSSSDVVATSASVAGSFPLASGLFTTATVTDLGRISTSNNTGTAVGTIDPGVTDRELWRFTLQSTNQKIEVTNIKMTKIGTINNEDLQNLYLEVAGVPVSSKVNLGTDATVTFDLSAAPLKFDAGQSKIAVLKGDVVNGAGRNFRFTIQRQEHFHAKDVNYNVNLKLNQSDTFTTVDPGSGSATSVNSGSLTMGVASDSPTGNVASSSLNTVLAKYTFKAVGEDVKVTSLNFDCTSASNTLQNVKLLLEGAQVGSTVTSLACTGNTGAVGAATTTFGSNFIVKAGTTKVLSVQADLNHSAFSSSETVVFRLGSGSSNAQGLATLTSLSTTEQASRTLTIQANATSVAIDQAFGNRTATNQTGVANGHDIKIASFIITGGAGDAADITQIKLKDAAATTQMGDNFQNLRLVYNGNPIGTAVSSLDTSGTVASYTFTPSPSLRISAGQTLRMEVYADIKSSPQDSAILLSPVVIFDELSATAVSTGTDAGYTTDVNLQDGYISAAGNLTLASDSATPAAQQLVMGQTDVEIARFKFTADASEAINVSRIIVSDQVSAAATGTLKNIKLKVGSTVLNDLTVSAFDTTNSTSTHVHADFQGVSLNVPKNATVVVKVFADIATFDDGGTSGSTHTIRMLEDVYNTTAADNTTGVEPATAVGAQSGSSITGATLDVGNATDTAEPAGNQMTVYRTKLGIRFASDSPSGAATGSASQTVAHFVLTNTANVGNYDATVDYMQFNLSQTGISNSAARTLTVYLGTASTLDTSTAYYTTGFTKIGGNDQQDFLDTVIDQTRNAFSDVTVASGSEQHVYVVMDTSDAGANDRLTITVGSSDISWGDGSSTGITTVNDLPLQSRTLTY